MSHIYFEMSSEVDPQHPGGVTVLLGGKLGFPDVRRFRAEIERLLACGYRRIDVDFTKLLYIDSSGLAELVPAWQYVREREGILTISNPRRLIRHILACAGLDHLVECDGFRGQALASRPAL